MAIKVKRKLYQAKKSEDIINAIGRLTMEERIPISIDVRNDIYQQPTSINVSGKGRLINGTKKVQCCTYIIDLYRTFCYDNNSHGTDFAYRNTAYDTEECFVRDKIEGKNIFLYVNVSKINNKNIKEEFLKTVKSAFMTFVKQDSCDIGLRDIAQFLYKEYIGILDTWVTRI